MPKENTYKSQIPLPNSEKYHVILDLTSHHSHLTFTSYFLLVFHKMIFIDELRSFLVLRDFLEILQGNIWIRLTSNFTPRTAQHYVRRYKVRLTLITSFDWKRTLKNHSQRRLIKYVHTFSMIKKFCYLL